MMNIHTIEAVLRDLLAKIKEHREDAATAILHGGPQDFAQFKEQYGKYAALSGVLTMYDDIKKKVNQEDE